MSTALRKCTVLQLGNLHNHYLPNFRYALAQRVYISIMERQLFGEKSWQWF